MFQSSPKSFAGPLIGLDGFSSPHLWQVKSALIIRTANTVVGIHASMFIDHSAKQMSNVRPLVPPSPHLHSPQPTCTLESPFPPT